MWPEPRRAPSGPWHGVVGLQLHAGVASRREADAWIGEGRVSVNGVVAVPGTQVAPEDRISVDGRHIRRPQPNAAPAATRVLAAQRMSRRHWNRN